jgi:hypothetical protein
MRIIFILIAENKTLKTKAVVARHMSLDTCVIYNCLGASENGPPETQAAKSLALVFTDKEIVCTRTNILKKTLMQH